MTLIEKDLKYRGLRLDPFQKKAVELIDNNKSVLVAAPTGVGKTLIADYVIERTYNKGGRVIYTAPIKALSNQKFKEFKAHIGEDAVGILTGDVVLNPEAPVLIMTTEIFRNMLQQSPEKVDNVHYVIFDEIHYIDDPERGSVWEESLIFMPPAMRFLGLSATIPNVEQFANWIGYVQEQTIEIVTHYQRVVPLKHQLYERNIGFTTKSKLRKKYKKIIKQWQEAEPWSRAPVPSTTHIDLIEQIKDGYFPCLFFTFSRKKAEMNALELGANYDFLDKKQKNIVQKVIAEVTERYPNIASDRQDSLQKLLLNGIGYHHAGMLPALKDIVEELFAKRLIQVLYCTETFAVGLNFPCRTVCFDSVTKWDGTAFRPLTNREYFQMAGRAGRRGIDEKGFVFALVNLNYFNPYEIPSMQEADIEPLESQFSLTYNSVLNLIQSYDEENIHRILGQNFATFQASAKRDELLEQIDETRGQLESFCEAMDLEACPLVYDRLIRKRDQYASKLKEQPKKRDRRRLHSQINSIDKALENHERRECSKQKQRECRKGGKLYRKLVTRYKRLLKREKRLNPQGRYIQEFKDKKLLLTSLGYLHQGKLTFAGKFASQIHGQELLVTELYMEGLFHKYSVEELNAIVVSIGYEPRKNESKIKHKINMSPVYKCLYQLSAMEEKFLGITTVQFYDYIAALAYRWSNGADFKDIVESAMIDEGDIVFAFRRGIDLLRQVRNACPDDTHLTAKMRECIGKMDRDEVSIWL